MKHWLMLCELVADLYILYLPSRRELVAFFYQNQTHLPYLQLMLFTQK